MHSLSLLHACWTWPHSLRSRTVTERGATPTAGPPPPPAARLSGLPTYVILFDTWSIWSALLRTGRSPDCCFDHGFVIPSIDVLTWYRWVIPIRSGNSCRISSAMSSLSSQNSNPSKALIRSFSPLTSFINFSYVFFKLMISWFWKKCYIHTSLYCIYKIHKIILRKRFDLCVTSYYLSLFSDL